MSLGHDIVLVLQGQVCKKECLLMLKILLSIRTLLPMKTMVHMNSQR